MMMAWLATKMNYPNVPYPPNDEVDMPRTRRMRLIGQSNACRTRSTYTDGYNEECALRHQSGRFIEKTLSTDA